MIMLISMSDHYARMLAISPAMCLWALAGTALASTTGFEQEGDPMSGLVVLLAVLCIIAAFAFFYLLADRMRQWRVDRVRGKEGLDGLVKVLGSSWLGPKAARALGEMGDERAVEPLIGLLHDRRRDLREAAADALGKIGDPRAIVPLSVTLKDDEYASVRDHARNAIRAIEG
jgi:hypothetical protein